MAYLIFMVLMAVALAASLAKWKLTKTTRDTPEDPESAEVKGRAERLHFLESKGYGGRRAQEDAELDKLRAIAAGGSGTTNPIARLLEDRKSVV